MISFMTRPKHKVSGPMPASRLRPSDKVTISLRMHYRERDHLARLARKSNVSMNSLILDAIRGAWGPLEQEETTV
jgi:hypothetical protein